MTQRSFDRTDHSIVGFLLTLGVLLLIALVPVPPTFAATDQLPDLGLDKFSDFHLDTTTLSGHKLLRFTSRIVNVGAGAFELHGSRPDTNSSMTVTQTIYDNAGGSRTVTTAASMFYAGDGHNHWHIANLQSTDLIRLDNGVKVGTAAKIGFCFNDNYRFNLSLPGAPQNTVYGSSPNVTCAPQNPSALTVLMGLSVGWGDTYGYTTNLQWVDITGLSSGRYQLKGRVDASHFFTESNTVNNCNYATLQITGNGSNFTVRSVSNALQGC